MRAYDVGLGLGGEGWVRGGGFRRVRVGGRAEGRGLRVRCR